MGALASFTFVDAAAATRTMTAKGIENGIARWRDTSMSPVNGQMTTSYSTKPADSKSKNTRNQVNFRQQHLNADGVVIGVSSINIAASFYEGATDTEVSNLLRAAHYGVLPTGSNTPGNAMLAREGVW